MLKENKMAPAQQKAIKRLVGQDILEKLQIWELQMDGPFETVISGRYFCIQAPFFGMSIVYSISGYNRTRFTTNHNWCDAFILLLTASTELDIIKKRDKKIMCLECVFPPL